VKAHGGPEAQHYNRLDMPTQALVHAGFEVLAPDFRGSLGYGRAYRKASDADLGGDDLTDVVAAASYLRDRGREQVGILGASYGGYMALMGVGATDAFDLGASVCGVVNWETTVENAREYLGDVLMRKLDGTPDEKPDLYEDRSPITHVDEIDVPLLVVQGANDPRVPEIEAEQLVSSLDGRGVDHEYLLFDDEGHGIVDTDNRIEYITRTVEFFRSHV
jgi:dipeptidyl aminopeptidase/acylaminoacyl peptidase